jgi:hypothetical protein
MTLDFAGRLGELIDDFVANADDPEAARAEVLAALELKTRAMKEEDDDEDD